jgi:hypothetical protein
MSLEIYPSIVHDSELSRDIGSSEIDDVCQRIHDACKGFGTNEKYVPFLGSMGLKMIASLNTDDLNSDLIRMQPFSHNFSELSSTNKHD